MNGVEVKDKIIDILADLFSEAGVDREVLEYVDLVDDLGMDSINFISIIELETAFNVQVPDEWLNIEKFRDFSAIYEAVEELLLLSEKGDNEDE